MRVAAKTVVEVVEWWPGECLLLKMLVSAWAMFVEVNTVQTLDQMSLVRLPKQAYSRPPARETRGKLAPLLVVWPQQQRIQADQQLVGGVVVVS